MFLDALALIIRQARGQWERWGGFPALQKKPNMSPQTCDNGTCQQRLAAEDDSRVHSALNVHVIKCYSFGSRIFSLPLLQLWGLWKRHNSRYCSWHAAIRKDCQFFFFFSPLCFMVSSAQNSRAGDHRRPVGPRTMGNVFSIISGVCLEPKELLYVYIHPHTNTTEWVHCWRLLIKYQQP